MEGIAEDRGGNQVRHRGRKLDPMLLLAFAVGIGVVVTTVVQASDDPLAPSANVLETGDATVALDLDVRWRPAGTLGRTFGDIVDKRRLDLAGGRGPRDTRLGISADPPSKLLPPSHRELATDSFNSTRSRAGVYLSISQPWD